MGARALPTVFTTRQITPTFSMLPANCLTFDQLFSHYHEAGFLYPEKLKKMTPYLDLIADNWTRGWAAGREILLTQVYREHHLNKMGTVTVFRSTHKSWQSQHLTSSNYAVGVLHLLMTAQDEGIDAHYGSGQNWYSPTNGFAMKIYGRMDRVLGMENADSRLLNYLQVPRTALTSAAGKFTIIKATDNDLSKVKNMAELCRGTTFCKGEELDIPDLELNRLDRIYRPYGLSRKRHIWLALEGGRTRGMVVAYRGPFGFNFSFLENRCDLMTDPFLSDEQRAEVCRQLLGHAAQVYFSKDDILSYPLPHLVVMADDPCWEALAPMGAVRARQYNHGLWLNQGFLKWKRYMHRVFAPVIRRYESSRDVGIPPKAQGEKAVQASGLV